MHHALVTMKNTLPTHADVMSALPVSDAEDSVSSEGDPIRLMMTLVLDLWHGYRRPSSTPIASVSPQFWQFIWVVMPLVLSPVEGQVSEICLHERLDEWRALIDECAAWGESIDALRRMEAGHQVGSRADFDRAVSVLLKHVRPALGDEFDGVTLSSFEHDAGRSLLLQVIRRRCDVAGVHPRPTSGSVVGMEGRALLSIHEALARSTTPRACGSAGCRNYISEDAAPQVKMCQQCRRGKGAERVRRHRKHKQAAGAIRK